MSEPRGAATSTISPFLWPMIALPTGDSFESLFSAGFASAEPTMWYSIVLFASMSRSRTCEPTETTSFEISFFVITRADEQPLLELRDPVLEHRLLVLRVVVLGVLGDVAELARDADAVGDLAPLVGREVLDLLLELLVALGGEDDFLHSCLPDAEKARRRGAVAAADCTRERGRRKPAAATICRPVQVDLRETWWIGDVEIPTRLVLAPMAGVSVQAFRRQGRRFGAGLVCSEMVSCAGLQHRNERTLGYLRIAADEHPLAVQIFGSEPGAMAEAARMVEAAGADIVDINFGCPVRKVTKTGAGATLLDDPDRACRIVDAVATAVDAPGVA